MPFISLCQNVPECGTCFVDISATTVILFVFSVLVLHGGYSYVGVQSSMPTQFTSCTNSLWNSHYIGDLFVLMACFLADIDTHTHTPHVLFDSHMQACSTEFYALYIGGLCGPPCSHGSHLSRILVLFVFLFFTCN